MLKQLFIFALSASFLHAAAQAPFQGVIKFKGENKTLSETSDVDWFVKDGNSRLDIKSVTKEAKADMSLYFVQGQDGVKMVGDGGEGQKVVYNIPYSAFANTEFSSAFSAEATGKKASYAGFECEEYTVTTASSVVSCWVSKSTGVSAASFPSIILGRGVFSVLQRNGVQGIPLKVTSKDFAGNIISDQEVVSIQASSVPESTFVIPAGYAKAN